MELLELVEFFVYLFAELLWPLVSALFRGIGWLLRGAFDLGRHLAKQLVKRISSPIPKAIVVTSNDPTTRRERVSSPAERSCT